MHAWFTSLAFAKFRLTDQTTFTMADRRVFSSKAVSFVGLVCLLLFSVLFVFSCLSVFSVLFVLSLSFLSWSASPHVSSVLPTDAEAHAAAILASSMCLSGQRKISHIHLA